ncbi:MAG: hypothetical protein PHE53_13500 [Thermoguttaceae bacterium]|nr:hypothetical protein [Thermoguttaceae bacterium]
MGVLLSASRGNAATQNNDATSRQSRTDAKSSDEPTVDNILAETIDDGNKATESPTLPKSTESSESTECTTVGSVVIENDSPAANPEDDIFAYEKGVTITRLGCAQHITTW